MTDQDAYLAFSDQYRMIDDQLDSLVAAATSYAQAQAITQSWEQANLNYIQSRNKLFADDSASLQGLYEQLVKSTENIKQALTNLGKPAGDIGKITAAITTGVNIAKNFVNAAKAPTSASPTALTGRP